MFSKYDDAPPAMSKEGLDAYEAMCASHPKLASPHMLHAMRSRAMLQERLDAAEGGVFHVMPGIDSGRFKVVARWDGKELKEDAWGALDKALNKHPDTKDGEKLEVRGGELSEDGMFSWMVRAPTVHRKSEDASSHEEKPNPDSPRPPPTQQGAQPPQPMVPTPTKSSPPPPSAPGQQTLPKDGPQPMKEAVSHPPTKEDEDAAHLRGNVR